VKYDRPEEDMQGDQDEGEGRVVFVVRCSMRRLHINGHKRSPFHKYASKDGGLGLLLHYTQIS
jgi:hypothetical protein